VVVRKWTIDPRGFLAANLQLHADAAMRARISEAWGSRKFEGAQLNGFWWSRGGRSALTISGAKIENPQ
jgi:hypothetical protein